MNKPTTFLLKLALPGLICLHQEASAALVSFDDLSPGVDSIIIPSGYSKLNWNNFGALIGTYHRDGYGVGTVSPQNIAFNRYGDPAEISASSEFDLVSAYLTSQLYETMAVTVRGYSGSTQIYSNVFLISNSAPAEINFNYLGVTRVRFEPPSTRWFAMDNLVVNGIPGLTNTPPQPTNSATGTVDLGTVTVSSPGHEFRSFGGFPGQSSQRVVADLLIDQDQNSGGGGTLPTVNIDWSTNNHFKLTIAAPAGMKFLIVPPVGVPAGFGGFLWWQSIRGGQSPYRESTVTFTGLEGTPPDFAGTDSVLSHFDGFFGWSDVESGPLTNSLAFTSMTLTGIGGPWNTGFGTTTFTPHNESELNVYYRTSAASDPGPFVSIVPLNQPLPSPTLFVPPALSMTMQSNGDMVLTFNGVLQSANSPDGPFQDVPGNPSGYLLVPKPNLETKQFFRTRIN